MKLKNIFQRIQKKIIVILNVFNVKLYMKRYTRYLQKCGVKIADYDKVGYIDPSAYIDSSDYSLISIARNVTISKEVMLLTHDFSIWTGMIANNKDNESGRVRFLKPISIGENCFIGARTFILPGTQIGKNCIIGAASVIKGEIPSGTVWCGNPAKQIMTTEEFTKRHIAKQDYQILK